MHQYWTGVIVLLSISFVLGGCTSTQVAESESPPVVEKIEKVVVVPDNTRKARLITSIANDSGGLTRLTEDYIYAQLNALDEKSEGEVADAFQLLLLGDMPVAHEALILALEKQFIHDPETSSLDLLRPELSAHFRSFAWEPQDYPGGPEGPNENLAMMLADSLDIVTPERRANRTYRSVITRDEATEEIWQYMLDQWVPVPGEGKWKLNRHAMQSYLKMREAAAADEVELIILSGHRDPKRAAANAARVGNSFAVASFSSHSLGLAIDFVLPKAQSDERFRLTTRPMQAVVDMRNSPVHKWLHLHAHKFGWYPFQHEPWHWEFNPPGFREVFFADYPDGPPVRE